MKANLFKSSLVIVLLAVSIANNAQTSNQKKTCITVEYTGNGKVIYIDTCFTGLNDAEIQKKLNAMGIKKIPDIQMKNLQNIQSKVDSIRSRIDSMKFSINKEYNNGKMKSEVIIINENNNGNDSDEKIKIISGKDGKNNTVILGSNGYAYTTRDNDSMVIWKVSGSYNHNKDSEASIYIKKIEIKDASDEDMGKIHSDIPVKGATFSDFKMYPNPTEGAFTISYNSTSTEPLKINVYDGNGKTIDTENITDPDTSVNKTVSLSAFGPGIYFVQLIQGNQTEIKKIIIK